MKIIFSHFVFPTTIPGAAFRVVLGNGKKTHDEKTKQNASSLQQNAFRRLLDRQYNDVLDLIASFLYIIKLFVFQNEWLSANTCWPSVNPSSWFFVVGIQHFVWYDACLFVDLFLMNNALTGFIRTQGEPFMSHQND